MAARKNDKIAIVNSETVPHEVLAKSIVDIAEAARDLKKSRLTEHAILVLLKDKTKVPMEVIKKVLDGAANLDTFIKR